MHSDEVVNILRILADPGYFLRLVFSLTAHFEHGSVFSVIPERGARTLCSDLTR